MNQISKFAVVLLLLAIVAVPAIADDEERYQTRINRELPFRGGIVDIDHQFGGVRIDTGSASHVHLRATISSSDPSFGQQIRVEAESTGSGVSIRTVYPSSTTRKGNFSYSVDLHVTVPAAARVRARNRFGSLHATGIATGSELVNGHGSISLFDAKGMQTVENQFGSIDVRNNGGDVSIRNAHGSVNAQLVRGRADVKNRFGSITVEEVERDARVENANGSVTVRDVRGAADVSNGFGTLAVQNIGGTLRATGNHSRVTVRDVRGDATIATTFAAVDASGIAGTTSITNNNGSVKATAIARDLRVKTSFASVMVSDAAGAVDVENQNGAISFASPRAACRPITLRTSFSTIKVDLPASANYAVNARTTFGRISSELPITTRTIGEETVIGTIGSGGCKLELVNANGNINIGRE